MIFLPGLNELFSPHNPELFSGSIPLRITGSDGKEQFRLSKNWELTIVTWAPVSITAEAGLLLISMGTIMDNPLDSSELEALTTISLMAGLRGLDSGATL